ncbi:hypothetical protein KUTeg_020518 [Tegillarca granosa]|uniref:Glutathione transferase n=1 Tax=Tegillarca granosa TaxID=220873 RepID=A0ABQ9EAV8_TEGGR|nr:hypothetical protein KUTeg_020518 [Tegillarca granosa]
MSKPTYKFMYFGVRARGELCRMVLQAAGQDFEDVRITFEEWPKLKPCEYLSTPTGVLPVLEINSDKLCQSMTIARYLAKEYKFYAESNMEQALIDQVVDTVSDLMGTLISWKLEGDATKKLSNFVFTYFGFQLTIADMAVYDVLVTLLKMDPKCLAKFPKLQANFKRVGEHPKLKKYLETRPDIDI